MLSDSEIRYLLKIKEIQIEPFVFDKLGPVSYDLSTRIEGEDVNDGDPTAERWVMTESIKKLPRLLKLVTVEKITLSPRYIGMVMCRSKTELRSLITSFSPLVDPGYSGHLIFLVLDTTGACIRVDDLFQITFSEVQGRVARPYNKRPGSNAQGRTGFNTTS